MNNLENIKNELKGLNSDLPAPQPRTPFSVPEGYFEGLAAAVMSRIHGENVPAREEIETVSPLLAGISRKMPFSIPSGYFNENFSGLPGLSDKDPEVNLSREMPYAVPSGYFDNLPGLLLERVAPRSAKVVHMGGGGRRWMRIAAAAVVAGILALSGFLYFTGGDAATTRPVAAPMAQQLKNVSTEELDEFIETTDINGPGNETAGVKRATEKTSEVRELLGDVSDKELDAFLNQVPTDDEDLFVIN